MTGLDLARDFYLAAVRPLLDGTPHAAALLGDGSEVLGFDDDVSPDHDFGPRCQVFVPAERDIAGVRDRLDGLPESFAGLPVRFPYGAEKPGHRVSVTTPAAFFGSRIGTDPAAGMGLADWLLTPTQRFATLTAGEVFADPDGALAGRRAALAWYPEDVWRYVLAAAWLRVGQEEPFVGRTGARGDDLGAAVVAARVARDLMRIGFLVERVWAPYSKWLGTAFARLDLADRVGDGLRAAVAGPHWRDRERGLTEAASHLAAATNALGLAPPQDPAPRRFHTRDITVVGAERLTGALVARVTDPEVRALLERLGARPNEPVPSLPGAVDQAVDSVDVLTRPARCRAAAGVVGVGA